MIKATDWNTYYNKSNKLASVTRKISEKVLLNLINKYIKKNHISITEIGGANSCFYDGFKKNLQPENFIVLDNNDLGLKMFLDTNRADSVEGYNVDVLTMNFDKKSDLVFSVGLIEHFEPQDTRKAILNHFSLLEKGGICLITFPTPTYLYRFSRWVLESLGLWMFPDERPLKFDEVVASMAEVSVILETKINWRIILTQGIVVARKK